MPVVNIHVSASDLCKAYDDDKINDWEYNYLIDVRTNKFLSEKQLAIKTKIIKKINLYIYGDDE